MRDTTIDVSRPRMRFRPTPALDGMTFSVRPGQATIGPNTLPISPWAGLGVLAAWAAAALLAGGLLLRSRDA